MAGVVALNFQSPIHGVNRSTTPYPKIPNDTRYKVSVFPRKYYSSYKQVPSQLKGKLYQETIPRRVLSHKRPTIISMSNYLEFEHLKSLGSRCFGCKKIQCICS
jgi:hypothetical protein